VFDVAHLVKKVGKGIGVRRKKLYSAGEKKIEDV